MKIIDIHTHGISGFDTITSSKDQILQIAKIQGSRGVTEIIPTIYSSSIGTMRENMHAIKRAMDSQKRECGSQKAEAKIIGIHLEGPFLNPLKCGALDSRSFIEPSDYNLNKLIDGFEDDLKIITVAPELNGSPTLIKTITDMGIICSMGHSDATYSETETGFLAGAHGITHIFNAMRGIHHREPGIAGFGLMNKDIYIEVIADPFHLDSKIIELIFSQKNAERIIIISDTVRDSMIMSPSGVKGNDKNILLGGSMTVSESSERLIETGVEKESVLKAISENPERYLQSESR